MSAHGRGLNRVLIAALACGLAITPVAHGGNAIPGTGTEEERLPWFFHDVINPSHSAEQRESELVLVIREADEGGRTAAMLLGRLYFMGDSHPANPAARDLERAEHYLQIALTSGDLESMLWLAELELAKRRPLEAAIWAQSYIQLRQEPEEGEGATGYIPSLLARIERSPGGSRIDKEALEEYVAGFVQTHGDRLREAAEGPDHRGTGWAKVWSDMERPECNVAERLSVDTRVHEPRRSPGGLTFRSGTRLSSSGRALFLIRIRTDGSVSDAMLVSSLPDVEYGMRVKPTALSMKFNEVPSDCRTRWGLAPITLINSLDRIR